MRKLDQEIIRSKDEIEKLNKSKAKIAEELAKNDQAGNKLMVDMKSCSDIKEDCQAKLDTKKADFNEMKRKINEIESNEQKIKDHVEELQRERNVCKDKCDKVK